MITAILFYLIWNSEIHQAHPTLIPVLLTLWIVVTVFRIFYMAVND